MVDLPTKSGITLRICGLVKRELDACITSIEDFIQEEWTDKVFDSAEEQAYIEKLSEGQVGICHLSIKGRYFIMTLIILKTLFLLLWSSVSLFVIIWSINNSFLKY